MPWHSNKSAKRHTRKAKSSKQQRMWRHVANSTLNRTGDEGAAVRAANGVIAKRSKKKGRKRSSKR